MAIHSISNTDLRQWLANDEAILIDVREPAEHANAKIPGAILLPLNEIDLDKLPKHAGKKMVLHCGGGTRSRKACEKLLSESQNLDLYNLEGGIRGWAEMGYEIE